MGTNPIANFFRKDSLRICSWGGNVLNSLPFEILPFQGSFILSNTEHMNNNPFPFKGVLSFSLGQKFHKSNPLRFPVLVFTKNNDVNDLNISWIICIRDNMIIMRAMNFGSWKVSSINCLWKTEHYNFALFGWYLFNVIFQKKLSEKLPL